MANENGESLQPWKSLESATFVAKWEIQIFTVEYATDSEDVTLEAQQYEYGQKLNLPMNLKNGELFLEGWYYDSEFNERVSNNASVKSDLTIYANWCEMIAISTVEDLKALGTSSDFIYYLENDINLVGENWTPLTDFKGVLYGNGYKIYNFSLSNTSGVGRYGIFAANSGKIYDVVVDDFTCNISYGAVNANVGILVGYNAGTVSGCSVINGSTKISSSTPSRNSSSCSHSFCYGNVVGSNDGGTVLDCVTSGVTITVNLYAYRPSVSNLFDNYYKNYVYFYGGGISGYSTGNIRDCRGELDVTSAMYTEQYDDSVGYAFSILGGIVGAENTGTGAIEECVGVTKISTSTSGNAYTYCYAGGIAGEVSVGKILRSITDGEINGVSSAGTRVGGIVGSNSKGEIVDSYSFAKLSGGYCGGIVGVNEGTVRSCIYAPKEETSIGLCGLNQPVGIVSKSISLTEIGIGSNSGTSNKVYSLADKDRATLLSYTFLIEELYWEESVWTVDKGGLYLPVLNWENE